MPPIRRKKPLRLARDQLDHLARSVIQLTDQHINTIKKVVIKRDRHDRDQKAECGRDQGQADSVGQHFAPRRSDPAAQCIERLDDPHDRSEQPQERTERSKMAAQDPPDSVLSSTTSPAAS